MKTIFRYIGMAGLLAVVIAAGAAATLAQDPCSEADAQAKLYEEFTGELKKKTIEGYESAVTLGQSYLNKYGKCSTIQADILAYVTKTVPAAEKKAADMKAEVYRKEQLKKFVDGVAAKNWDDVYASGKALLAIDPKAFRGAELVLGSIGLDETQKKEKVTKYNDETIRYAKMALADMERKEEFADWGLRPFDYTIIDPATKKADPIKSRDEAIGWLNYTIGYILAFDKNNKKEAAGYLFKATRANSGTVKVPAVYRSLASFYIEEANKRFDESKAAFEKAKNPPADATDEIKEQLAKDYETKQGLFNATTELAIEAVARAYQTAKEAAVATEKSNPTASAASKAYAADQYLFLKDLYNNRFGNMTGVDAFIAQSLARPLTDPATPIQPKIDVKPSTTATGTTTGSGTGTTTGPKSGMTPATKPAVTPAKPTTPATKPATPGSKPSGSVTALTRTGVKRKPTR